MFESAELGNALDKKSYDKELPALREALLQVQRQLAGSDQALVILVAGVEGAGKSETVNQLLEWLDARGVQTHTFFEPTEEQSQRPEYWRYWGALPPAGRMSIFFGSWYTRPIVDHAFGRIDKAQLDQQVERIVEFEQMLSNEKVILLKLWMHLSKKAQKSRMKALEKDPRTAWRVSKRDWKFFKHYDEFRDTSEQVLRRTSSGEAPWHIVEAEDERYRSLTVGKTLLSVLQDRLAAAQAAKGKKTKDKQAKAGEDGKQKKAALPVPPKVNQLNQLELTLKLSKEEYEDKLLALQGKLNQLTRELRAQDRSAILVFEGADAAGKGGAIRRLTHAMDARLYEVKSVAAPSDEERAHPYLWRFWRHLPSKGRITIYDRSWYGRVLVERVEGFCAPADWQRAYAEINAFEEQLAEAGTLVLKFWLAISADEQLLRFKDREITPYKQYKITEEDWRNRAKWNAYEAAACEMFEKTGTEDAPWTLVEANDKLWARVKVLKSVVKALEKAR